MTRIGAVAVIALFAVPGACAPAVRATRPPGPAAELAQLWGNPVSHRNLSRGPGDDGPLPETDAAYDVLKRDPSGFSITYRVRDRRDRREWSVKIGPEAQSEVVSSRILWAMGYHQLASHFVRRWIAVTEHGSQVLGGGRFRPREEGLKSLGTWSWQQNPFVGTRPYNGLLVLMMILNSTDLKNENNALFDVIGPTREGARRWYVVKDLGASLGETGRMDPRRGDVAAFEREPFIVGFDGPWVRFGFRGRHQELLQRIGPEDVRWTCERLQRLTDRDWRDAFAAGGFDEAQTVRYVAQIRKKIDRGLHLDRTEEAP